MKISKMRVPKKMLSLMRLSLPWGSCRIYWLSLLDNCLRSVCPLPTQVPTDQCLCTTVKQNRYCYGKIAYYAITVSMNTSFQCVWLLGRGKLCTCSSSSARHHFHIGCKKWSRWAPVTQSEFWDGARVLHSLLTIPESCQEEQAMCAPKPCNAHFGFSRVVALLF